ncbi:hypothetical protein GEMRC1_002069 [Eukaryota sp. GEM-RC1]
MSITPEEVLNHTEPSATHLCSLADNTYGLDFLEFRVRDFDNKSVLFQISRDTDVPTVGTVEFDTTDPTHRTVKYAFPQRFLTLKNVGTQLKFQTGDAPISNLRLIERFYFRNRLIKTFDFKFSFCMPNTTNTWEAIYEMPKLSNRVQKDMLENPYETQSDTYYFVEDKLILHQKAFYSFK